WRDAWWRVRLVWGARDPPPQLAPHPRVERAEGLVEEQHGRVDRERAREPHPLALAARELRWVALRKPLELDELQQSVHAVRDLRLRPLPDLQAERDVVVDGQGLKGRVVLEDEADAAVLRWATRHVDTVDHDAPGVGALEPGDDPQQGRLAAAAGAEERGERALGHLHRDVVECDEVVEALRDAQGRDGHQCLAPFGWRTSIATRTRIAVAASTNAMPYAGA